MAAPRISPVFASTTIFMKPCVSPFSTARVTLVMARLATSAGRPPARTSASDSPARPSGGAVYAAKRRGGGAPPPGGGRARGGPALEMVGGGGGEGGCAVKVAQGPDALDVGAELIVGHDVAAPAHGDAGPLEAEVVGVGTTAHRQQDVGPHHLGRPLLAVHPRDDVVAAPGERDALRVQAYRDALVFQDALDRRGDILVLAGDEPVGHLDDRHLAPEAPVHLPELEPDVASPHDDQVGGQVVDVHHRAVGQVGYLADPRHVGNHCPTAHV